MPLRCSKSAKTRPKFAREWQVSLRLLGKYKSRRETKVSRILVVKEADESSDGYMQLIIEFGPQTRLNRHLTMTDQLSGWVA